MSYLERDQLGIYRNAKQGPGPALMGADTLIGEDVRNPADESLGDIKEIMIDMQSGQVAYAVLSYGGVMGMGQKLFAVPWGALRLDTDAKCFRLNASKESLKNAPGFDSQAWPSMADPDWSRTVHEFYGTTPVMA